MNRIYETLYINSIHTDQRRRRKMNAHVMMMMCLIILIRHWIYARKYVILQNIPHATGMLGCQEQCLLHVDCVGVRYYNTRSLHCVLHLEEGAHPDRDGYKLFIHRSDFQVNLSGPCRSTVCDDASKICLTDSQGRPQCVTQGVTGCLPPRWNNVQITMETSQTSIHLACRVYTAARIVPYPPTIHTMTCAGGRWSKDVRRCLFVRAVDTQEMKTSKFDVVLPLPFDIDRRIYLEGQQIGDFQFGFSLLVRDDVMLYFCPRFQVKDTEGNLHDDVLSFYKIRGYKMITSTYKENPFIFMGQFRMKVVHDEDRYTVSSGKFNWTLRDVTRLPPMRIFMFGVNMTSIVIY